MYSIDQTSDMDSVLMADLGELVFGLDFLAGRAWLESLTLLVLDHPGWIVIDPRERHEIHTWLMDLRYDRDNCDDRNYFGYRLEELLADNGMTIWEGNVYRLLDSDMVPA